MGRELTGFGRAASLRQNVPTIIEAQETATPSPVATVQPAPSQTTTEDRGGVPLGSMSLCKKAPAAPIILL